MGWFSNVSEALNNAKSNLIMVRGSEDNPEAFTSHSSTTLDLQQYSVDPPIKCVNSYFQAGEWLFIAGGISTNTLLRDIVPEEELSATAFQLLPERLVSPHTKYVVSHIPPWHVVHDQIHDAYLSDLIKKDHIKLFKEERVKAYIAYELVKRSGKLTHWYYGFYDEGSLLETDGVKFINIAIGYKKHKP